MKVRITPKNSFKAIGYSVATKEGEKADIIQLGAYWLGADFSSVSYEDYDKLAKGVADQIGMWFRPEERKRGIFPTSSDPWRIILIMSPKAW
ncbi:hypothetical protein [Desulfosporosinus shakirovi]|uniref:hypothetical protein n=1 Tax=Desulfosporosinus shakirovi TaxID=2885154 RepID=UPI001E5194D7|nr:hypothetical protein [Desulfosporosinus sp. SRJS8]MCB8818492.1 hypothetical protein [Desulfosporosinus sp. SRJS8]